jgi:hypothetical protein
MIHMIKDLLDFFGAPVWPTVLQDVESSDGDARFEIDGKVNHGDKL